MLTSAQYVAKLAEMGITISSAEVITRMRANMMSMTEEIPEVIPLDSSGNLFRLTYMPIVDTLITVFRSTTRTTLTNTESILEKEDFDFQDITFVQTKPVAIDHYNATVKFLTPVNTSTEFVLFRYAYVNEDALFNEIYLSQSLKNRVIEEKRGNVSIKKQSILDIVAKSKMLNQMSGDDIQEINVTRFSCGQEWGRVNE